MRALLVPLAFVACVGVGLAAEPALTTQIVASSLTKPLLVTHAPNDYARIFVMEQNGKIKIRKNGSFLPTPFLDLQPLMGGSESYLEYGLAIQLARGLFAVHETGVVHREPRVELREARSTQLG